MTSTGAPRIFSDRLFCDALSDTECPDFEFANALVLGLDMPLATGEDARFVEEFLGRLFAQDEDGHFDDLEGFSMKSFRGQIHEFSTGFTGD